MKKRVYIVSPHLPSKNLSKLNRLGYEGTTKVLSNWKTKFKVKWTKLKVKDAVFIRNKKTPSKSTFKKVTRTAYRPYVEVNVRR